MVEKLNEFPLSSNEIIANFNKFLKDVLFERMNKMKKGFKSLLMKSLHDVFSNKNILVNILENLFDDDNIKEIHKNRKLIWILFIPTTFIFEIL